jgi:hypothetical protein
MKKREDTSFPHLRPQDEITTTTWATTFPLLHRTTELMMKHYLTQPRYQMHGYRTLRALVMEVGTERPESFCSSSTPSVFLLLRMACFLQQSSSQWQFYVVLIGSGFLGSDNSSLPGIQDPPGLRSLRKPPMRRDFEFIHKSGVVYAAPLRNPVNNSTPSETVANPLQSVVPQPPLESPTSQAT